MKKYKNNPIIIILILLILVSLTYYLYDSSKINKIKDIYINDNNKIVIEFNDNQETYCYIGNDLKNPKWVKINKYKCIYDFNDSKYIYLKNKYNRIFKYNNKKLVKLLNLKIETPKIYLALNGEEKIKYSIEMLGKTDKNITFKSNDENIATVSKDGLIKGISIGKTNIILKYLQIEEKVEVIVTDKIIVSPNEFDYNKSYLGCGMYSKEDNDLLDEILEYRVNQAGYKTRAGVVAAARFISLEFPYRINYFSENGRMHPYGVGATIDAEGRYYHKGLFLDESRFSLLGPKMHGPATWGCEMYSFPSEGMRKNGFDCSGFITWILYNGGFECEDLGAGVSTIPDMTDLGTKVRLNEALNNNKIKAGDLLSGDVIEGGHIALVAGIKDDIYYVAESLWFGGTLNGAQIRPYTVDALLENFYWQVDMEEYYGEEGDYTEYWK